MKLTSVEGLGGVTARIGNTDIPLLQSWNVITANEKCGETLPINGPNVAEVFRCNPPLDGQYLSLQPSHVGKYLQLREVIIGTSEYRSGSRSSVPAGSLVWDRSNDWDGWCNG